MGSKPVSSTPLHQLLLQVLSLFELLFWVPSVMNSVYQINPSLLELLLVTVFIKAIVTLNGTIPNTHTVKGESQLLQVILLFPHAWWTYTQNKNALKELKTNQFHEISIFLNIDKICLMDLVLVLNYCVNYFSKYFCCISRMYRWHYTDHIRLINKMMKQELLWNF